jgi:hypothetical protein
VIDDEQMLKAMTLGKYKRGNTIVIDSHRGYRFIPRVGVK